MDRIEQRFAVKAIAAVAPLGWAFHGRWDLEGTKTLIALHEQGIAPDEIDAAASELWNTTGIKWLEWAASPIRRWGNEHTPFKDHLWRRVALFEQAFTHHVAGDYAASVLLVLSQLDGLTKELTGFGFFTLPKSPDRERFVDNRSMAGLPGNLDRVRAPFSEQSWIPQRTGSLSRHGILHGNELGYDTKLNSTKCFVLLGALVEHLETYAATKGAEYREQHDAQVAGVSGTDEDGRLLDNRQLRDALQLAWDVDVAYTHAILVPGLYSFNASDDVPVKAAQHGLDPVELLVTTTDDWWWWSYQLPSGYALAMAGRPNEPGVKPPAAIWRWEGDHRPTEPPWSDPTGWRSDDDLPRTINWEPVPFGLS